MAWTSSQNAYVGNTADGSLTIDDGSTIRSNDVYLGFRPHVTGMAMVSGHGSAWNSRGSFFVGYLGSGDLSIQDGAVVNSSSSSVGGSVSSNSVAIVSGVGSTWYNQVRLNVGSSSKGTLTVSAGGVVEIGSNGLRGILSMGTQYGIGGVNLEEGGTLRLRGGDIELTSTGKATFNFSGGRLEGVGSFYTYNSGRLIQNGGALAPGNSAGVTRILGDYDLRAGSLEIELFGDGGVAGTDYDQLVVTEDVSLGDGATLEVLLNYPAEVGDSFLIVNQRGSKPVGGLFASHTDLTTAFGDYRYGFSVNYAAGDGNDIGLTVASIRPIPEPNALALLLSAGLAVRCRDHKL